MPRNEAREVAEIEVWDKVKYPSSSMLNSSIFRSRSKQPQSDITAFPGLVRSSKVCHQRRQGFGAGVTSRAYLRTEPNMVEGPSMCNPKPPSKFWWLCRYRIISCLC